jgi:hypothetical protein
MWPFLQTTNTNCDCEPASSNQCGCSKISSLDVAYSGPNLACSGIELCDSLSVVLQKIEEKICTAGTIFGSGTNNYISKWTPNGITLGNSQVYDDGTFLSISTSPSINYKLKLDTPTENAGAMFATSKPGTHPGAGVYGRATGITSGTSNIGVIGRSDFNENINIGVQGVAGNDEDISASVSIGGEFTAQNGIDNYSLRLVDGTQDQGRFLKSITDQGHANWSNITTADITGFPSSVVGGSGTLNFLARWTPNGSTLGTGLIQDNGSTISIGTTLDPNTFINASTTKIAGIVIINENTTNVIRNAISASTNGISAAENRGIEALAMNSTLLNTGVSGNAISELGADAVGGSFNSSGSGTNYSLQLRDGTQAVNKVLASMTSDGKSNWSKVTSNYTTGATGSFTSQDGKTVTVTNGLITSIV